MLSAPGTPLAASCSAGPIETLPESLTTPQRKNRPGMTQGGSWIPTAGKAGSMLRSNFKTSCIVPGRKPYLATPATEPSFMKSPLSISIGRRALLAERRSARRRESNICKDCARSDAPESARDPPTSRRSSLRRKVGCKELGMNDLVKG